MDRHSTSVAPPCRVAVAGSHPLSQLGLQSLLASVSGFEFVFTCGHFADACQQLSVTPVEILLVDQHLPGGGGLVLLHWLQQSLTPIRTVLMVEGVDEAAMLNAIGAGVNGIFPKALPNALLLQCLYKVAEGGDWLEYGLAQIAVNKAMHSGHGQHRAANLTPRERELVRLAAGGLSNTEIAQRLCISSGTAKVHIHNIYAKLKLRSRVALANFARENGLV